VGFAEYRSTDHVLVFPHTVVAQHRRGRGDATTLIQGALDDVRRRGLRIVPECSFVAAFIEDNPEYGDLVVPAP
jgi:hypothetical protein